MKLREAGRGLLAWGEVDEVTVVVPVANVRPVRLRTFLPLTVVLPCVFVTSCGGDGGTLQSDWWLSEIPSGNEVPVVVYTASSSCNDFDRVEVDETADEVTIRAYVDFTGDTDCTADYTWHPAPVELDAPLGTRVLRGCTAPEDGLRAADLQHDDVDCRTLIKPDEG